MPYFAFFYFGQGAGSAPVVDVPGSIYFAPTYWPQSYFPVNYFSILAIDITTTGVRDRDIFNDMKARLDATNSFETVLLHQSADRARASADRKAVVAIRRTGVVDQSKWDPIEHERTVSYEVGLAYRCEDEVERFEAVERLEQLMLNAMNGQCLAGATLIPFTTLSRGRDDPRVSHPEQRVILTGQFTYFTTGYSGRNTAA